MTTNYGLSTQKKSWFFHEGKDKMDKAYKKNMEEFDQRVNKMLKLINIICLQKQKKREEQQVEALAEYPRLIAEIVIPNEDQLDFKNGQALELKEFKNYYDHFRKPKYTKNVMYQGLEQIRMICDAQKYPLKVSLTASTYFQRFYFKKNILEYNPHHVLIVCIFLANKTERAKHQFMRDFRHQIMSNMNENDKVEYCDLVLHRDTWKDAFYHIVNRPKNSAEFAKFKNSDDHELAYMKDLEIEVCRAINFEFLVHHPLTNIQFMKNLLIEHFRQNGE